MNSIKTIITAFIVLLFISCSKENIVDRNLNIAEDHYSKMVTAIGKTDKNPRTIDKNGNLIMVNSGDWTSGFFPGCLWKIYEYTKQDKWKSEAQFYTRNIEKEKFNNTTHDLGFMLYCSFGNGYRLTGNSHYKDILIQSAKTLITRFNPKVGCIKSWESNDRWDYPVIIDNMMNLELLFWATKETGDSTFYNIAVTHANTTIKNHFRKDYSTWHVLSYDTATGQVLKRNTAQGYEDESCWARGESWALYGFTMCYRETKDGRYLKQAKGIAKYILTSKNLPEDMIPYWDYNASNIPNEVRDASAAAIMASALYELSTFVNNPELNYKESADRILKSLSSPKYLNETGNSNFILMHATGSKPADSEVDVPLIYADYYFIEANLRKLNIETKN
ncbi:glycoside hydrolase family 88 protein [bacterium BMS3Abin03]|nr:glycoside hydrolase family 88 protein [bacterium BMS3Abin03]